LTAAEDERVNEENVSVDQIASGQRPDENSAAEDDDVALVLALELSDGRRDITPE